MKVVPLALKDCSKVAVGGHSSSLHGCELAHYVPRTLRSELGCLGCGLACACTHSHSRLRIEWPNMSMEQPANLFFALKG